MTARRSMAIAGLALPLFISGCSLLPMKRHLPVPKPPSSVQTATPEELVAQVNQRWDGFKNLTATVEIQATLLKPQEGLATDYPTVRGWIVMEKPNHLRVAGQYLGIKAFDMASDGSTFTLLVPTKNKAIRGPNTVTKKSDKQFENIRPGFFFDAMIVRGVEPDNFYSETSDIETIEDAAKKHLFTMPEYILNITRHAPNGSRRDTPVRVLTFHRDDLLPSNQDMYDSEGKLESQVTYSSYKSFGDGKFPTRVVIKRPLDGIQIVLTVEKVVNNQEHLPADEFSIKIPSGAQIQDLH